MWFVLTMGCAEPDVIQAHCGFDDCTPLEISGDPIGTLDGSPAPFRGYGDPSVGRDADGDAWLTYSWLDVAVSGEDVDFVVRTHLARWDGGEFVFERSVNEVTEATHPDSGEPGWTLHEVSTWTLRPDGRVEALWMEYFEGMGEAERSDLQFTRSIADTPEELGDSAEPAFHGWATSAAFGGTDLSAELPELADCASFTEPDLFTDGESTFLAATCMVFDGAAQDYDATRLVLLREVGDGWEYVGVLLSGADAQSLGADTLEQVDVSRDADGGWLLLVTPVLKSADPLHQGCLGLTVETFDPPVLLRDADDTPTVRLAITGEGDVLGPGLCTHDRDLPGGIVMVLSSFDLDGAVPDIAFGLYSTGVAP